ncbi:type III secretion chaperone SycN [Pseudomonas aeruginosa]|nr:type III secretion chaperone SycN [Pseudomonas aeruginosa]
MDWVELAVAQFCQDLRVSVPAPLARVVQLDFEDSGTLQLERHGEQLSLWLACDLAWHQAYRGTLRALRLCRQLQEDGEEEPGLWRCLSRAEQLAGRLDAARAAHARALELEARE